MKLASVSSLLLAFGGVFAAMAEEPKMERRVLSDGAAAKAWSQSEATMESSTDVVKTGGPSLHWRVTVDHHAGEPKYPIGWPRVSLALKGGARDWSAWDYLHFWIRMSTSRKELPRVPAVLNIPQGAAGKTAPFMLILSDLKKDRWLEVRIPVAKLAVAKDVHMLQFNIAEDQYHHQDTLDFYIDDLALLRHATPALVDFTAVNAVMFSDARSVPASFMLSGIPAGEPRRVTLELRQAGAVIAASDYTTVRGTQRLVLDVSKAVLKPGEYELAGSVEGGAAALSSVRVVASPWQQARIKKIP